MAAWKSYVLESVRGRSTRRLVVAIVSALLTLPLALSAADETAVICNPEVNISALSARELTDIFLGRKRTLADGKRIQLAILVSGPEHSAFLKERVGKSEQQFRRHWRNLVFSGQGVMPKTFRTQAELMEYVSSREGAIGYIAGVDPTKRADIKVISILKESGE